MRRIWEEIYVTDFGTLTLRPGQLERAADASQTKQWERHADDLIGVPEVAPDNERVRARMTAKMRKLWEAGA